MGNVGRVEGLGLIMPFVGGKRQLLPEILPRIPRHTTYLEAFGGGAAVFFSKKPAPRTVLNDADPFLARFYRDFSCRKVSTCRKIKNVCGFARQARERVIRGSSDVCDQLAARRFTVVAAVTSGLKTDECRVDPIVTKKLEKRCPEFEARLKRSTVTNLDFREAFRRYDAPGTFTFMDPPYPATTQPYQPQRQQHQKVHPAQVCELARKAKGKVLITYNDLPVVRDACRGLYLKSVRSRHVSAHVTKSSQERRELLIANYPL